MAAYFLPWLIKSGFDAENGETKYFIYLTNWSFLVWCGYLVVSALSATIKVIEVYCCKEKGTRIPRNSPGCSMVLVEGDRPVGCCDRQNDATSWYQKIQWIMFYCGTEMAIAVTILYWTVIYQGGEVSGVDANTHLVNGIFALVDIAISGVPVRIFHAIYPLMITGTYSVFTGIYYAANGTNVQGERYIYGVLDYDESPGTAAGWILGTVLVLLPLLHMAAFGLYSARLWISYCLCGSVEVVAEEDEENRTLKKEEKESDNAL